MLNNSVWGGNEQQETHQDIASLLRSPLFYGAAVVIVAAVMVVGALSSEGWVEVGPIPVLQEKAVSYVDDEGIFVFWNEGEPYGIHEKIADEGTAAVYCAADELFLGPGGELFARDGRALEGSDAGLLLLPAKTDGHLVFVNADATEGERLPAEAHTSPSRPACTVPSPDDRGILEAS